MMVRVRVRVKGGVRVSEGVKVKVRVRVRVRVRVGAGPDEKRVYEGPDQGKYTDQKWLHIFGSKIEWNVTRIHTPTLVVPLFNIFLVTAL